MAGSTITSFRSTQTALALLPPSDVLNEQINTLRCVHDKRASIWPAHITLLFPFVPRAELPIAVQRLRKSLSHSAFAVDISDTGVFVHKKNATVFLKPSQAATLRLRALRESVLQALEIDEPEPDREFAPHVTIGQTGLAEMQVESLGDKARRMVEGEAEMRWIVDRIAVMLRGEDGVVRKIDEVFLDGAVTPASGTVGDSTVVVEDAGQKTCYWFDRAGDRWVEADDDDGKYLTGELGVATYNVLADSFSEPGTDRYELILKAIESAPATVLCLQEVTDTILTHLLHHKHIRVRYPYASHGSSSVLPSVRNCVIFSSHPFNPKWVPFPARHKGAQLAIFGQQLIVAVVHLTCGLSNSGVEAKYLQMKSLTEFLQNNCEGHEWIVAGDFNIVTSSHSLGKALQKGSISQASAELVREAIIDPAVYVDAWEIGYEPGNEDRNEKEGGLTRYTGESGATFDRLTNPLAGERMSEVADVRPQRYDRILLKRGGSISVDSVNRFGFADASGRCGSDHYGVRAMLRTPPQKSELSTAVGSPVKPQPQIAVPEEVNFKLPNLPGLNQTDKDLRKSVLALLNNVLSGSGPTLSLVLAPLGSYALGTYSADSDLDLLCVSVISRKTFFALAKERLRAHASVRILRYVNAIVPMLELDVLGIKVDLQYCQAAAVLARWGEVAGLERDDELFDPVRLTPASAKTLNAYRDIQYLLRTIPNLDTYREAYAFLKTWLKANGLYSSRFGYFGGIHLSLLLSRVAKLAPASTPSAGLVAAFISHYASFDWAHNIASDPDTPVRYQRAAREAIVILGIHTPTVRHNVAQNATRLTAETLTSQLRSAHDSLSALTLSEALPLIQSGMRSFINGFSSFLKISIAYWGHPAHVRPLVGFIESRIPSLLVDIGTQLPNVYARVWPGRFWEHLAPDDPDLQGFYLIGISSTSTSVDSKKAVISRLNTVRNAFEQQLRESKLYDETSAWIEVRQVPRKALEDATTLDTREWGTGAADNDASQEEEEEEEEEETTHDVSENPAADDTTPPRTKKTPAPITPGTKLRPAHDVLHRLLWDPDLGGVHAYAVGYEDRFAGVMECPLSRWEHDKSGRDWVPMHRVLYFKRKADGAKVWDRERRSDAVFGSGVGVGGGDTKGADKQDVKHEGGEGQQKVHSSVPIKTDRP